MKKLNISKPKLSTKETELPIFVKNQPCYYAGGAGPSEELAKHNNQVLSERLRSLKILFVQDTSFLKKLTGVKQTPLLKIKHPVRKRNKYIFAGYDRWGYVIDLLPEEAGDIDQANIEETIKAIENWYGKTV